MTLRHRIGAMLGVTVVAIGVALAGAGTASASGTTPEAGQICRAEENIFIYVGSSRYTVQAGGGIRIFARDTDFNARGNGNGQPVGTFQWRRSDGSSRLSHC